MSKMKDLFYYQNILIFIQLFFVYSNKQMIVIKWQWEKFLILGKYRNMKKKLIYNETEKRVKVKVKSLICLEQ